MDHDVFISYSHKDKLIADTICPNLEIDGVRCWIAPRDIGPGEQWPEAIGREIPQSRVMVMIFSSNSNNSDQVYRELFIAADNKVVIIPFKIEDVELNPRIGFLLAGTHWLDAISPPMQEQINILVTRVKSILGPRPPTPTTRTGQAFTLLGMADNYLSACNSCRRGLLLLTGANSQNCSLCFASPCSNKRAGDFSHAGLRASI